MTIDGIVRARAIVDAYLATWNAADEQERHLLLDRHWSPGLTDVDPLASVEGPESMSAVIAGAHDQFPSFEFSLVGEIDAHHDQLRFQWGLGPVGAPPLVIGFDVVVLDHDGRISDVRGFLDVVPT